MSSTIRIASTLILACVWATTAAHSDTYNWNGGTGNWDTSTANWTGFGTTWPAASTGNDDAVFGGTAGTVTLTTAITANDLTFSTNNYIVSGNTLTLDGTTPTITVSPATATINSALAGLAFAKSGTGTLVLGGANGAYASGFKVSQGKVQMATGANSAFGTGNITLGDANTGANTVGLSFNGLTANTNIGAITVDNFGSGTTIFATVNAANNNQSPTFGLVLNKAVTLTVGESNTGNQSDLVMSSISGPGAGAGNNTLIIDAYNGANRTLRTSISNSGTASTFTGNVLVQRGTWNMQNRSYVSNTAANQNLIIPDTSSVTVNAGATWSLVHGVETIDALNGGGNVTYNSGTSFLSDPHLTVGAGNGSGTFSGNMTAGGFRFGKSGSGTQTLSGNNTYSGTTTLNGSVLQAGSTTGLSANSAFTLANASGVVLDLNGFNSTIGSLAGGGATGGNVTLGSGTLSTNGNNSSTSYGGIISGTGGIVKRGTGTLTLTNNNNSYSGGTTLSQGTITASGINRLTTDTNKDLVFGDVNTSSANLKLSMNGNFGLRNVTISTNATGTNTLEIATGGGTLSVNSIALNRALTIATLGGALADHQMTATTNVITGGTTAGTDALTISLAGGQTLRSSLATGTAVGAISFTGNVRLTGNGTWQMQNISYNGNSAANQNLWIPDTSSVTVDTNVTWAITHGVETIDGLNGAGTVRSVGSTNYLAGTAVLTVGAANGNGNYTGVMQDNGNRPFSFAKIGTGTQTLAGASTYSGGTTVSGGMLLVNNTTGSGTGSGSVSVGATATLGGTGAIGGTVNVTGTLSPGASIESLASGALTMNSGSTFVFEAVDNTSTGADLMAVNGALSLANVNLDLTGANLAAGTWLVGDKLTLISYNTNTITSGFAGYANDTIYLFGVNQWLFKYNDSFAGNNYKTQAETTGTQFVTMTLVPEPGSLAMLALGMLSLWLFRRKRG